MVRDCYNICGSLSSRTSMDQVALILHGHDRLQWGWTSDQHWPSPAEFHILHWMEHGGWKGAPQPRQWSTGLIFMLLMNIWLWLTALWGSMKVVQRMVSSSNPAVKLGLLLASSVTLPIADSRMIDVEWSWLGESLLVGQLSLYRVRKYIPHIPYAHILPSYTTRSVLPHPSTTYS